MRTALKRRMSTFHFALAALALVLAAPATARANPCTVTSVADDGAGTLRALIADASCDTINFGVSLPATIALTSGQLTIDRDVTINGPGADTLTVKRSETASNLFGVFQISSGTVSIGGLTISNGQEMFGGGIGVGGTLTLTNSVVTHNNEFYPYVPFGGIYAGFGSTLTVSNTTVSFNGRSSVGVGGIYSEGTLVVSDSSISNNKRRGLVHFGWTGPATITHSTISNNTDGGIAIVNGSSTIADSTVSNNTSTTSGGGIAYGASTFEGGHRLIGSTVSGNTAEDYGLGGGVYNVGANLEIVNSTVSSNTASGIGGGVAHISNDDPFGPSGVTLITNSTVAGNTAAFANSLANIYQEVLFSPHGTVALTNTVLATNAGDNCPPAGAPPLPGVTFDPITDAGHNMESGDSCGFNAAGSVVNTDPFLGPLQNNGGPTWTHALNTLSYAIDAGACDDLSGHPVTIDQRGVARPQGAGCDVGAYEMKAAFPFSGFLDPVDDLPIVNKAKAGSAIPVKFSLSGNRGLNIFAAHSPVSQQVSCSSANPVSEIEQTVTAGASSLSYDATKDLYSYVWKTNAAWKGTCRQLMLTLTDDTTHVAIFQFK